ncbi:hypothetical protein D3C75_956010 [compost metagenome]
MPAPGTKRTKEGIERFRPEDDGHALNLMAEWVGDSTALQSILVDNPQRLYWRLIIEKRNEPADILHQGRGTPLVAFRPGSKTTA